MSKQCDTTLDDLDQLAEHLPLTLSVAEVAELSGLNPGTVRNRVYLRLPPRPFHAGRRLRFTRTAVVEWLKSSRDPVAL